MDPTKKELRALLDAEVAELCSNLYTQWRFSEPSSPAEHRAARRWARVADEVVRRERRRLRRLGRLLEAADLFDDEPL